MAFMPLPKVLPRTVTAPLSPPLMAGMLTYCDLSDVTKSRLIQRALGAELARIMREDSKLKEKIERAMNKYGNSTSHKRK